MKLHIGCGKVILPGWTNLDIEPGPGVDIVGDARELESIDRESVDIIYASHILDHFGRHEIADVLALWFSRLKPGGTLRIAVSNFSAVVAEYASGAHNVSRLLGHIVGGHKTPFDKHGVVFDLGSLTDALEAAGFVDVARWNWRETEHAHIDDFSQAYMPHMDKENGRLMSLNLQAKRPDGKADIGREFYLDQIKRHGLSPAGSVPDKYIREQEENAIVDALALISRGSKLRPPILDVGCGSGLLLARLYHEGYQHVSGFDFLPEFVELARSRGLPYHIWQSDVRNICGGFEDGKPIAVQVAGGQYGVVISQRVVINVLSPEEQCQAFSELVRVLEPGGYLILVEAFADAWRELNEARAEFDLPPHPMAAHNRWLERSEFDKYTQQLIPVKAFGNVHLAPPNFLSGYFYATRVLHDLAHRATGKRGERDSHFARAVGASMRPVGNYANIQFYVFRKE